MKTFIESLPDAVMLISETGHIIAANSLVQDLFGYTVDELLSMNSQELTAADARSEYVEWQVRFFESRKKQGLAPVDHARNIRAVLKDGSEIMLDVRLNHVETEETGSCLISAIRETGAEDKTAETSSEAANRDALTELPNKSRFMDSLKKAVVNGRADGRFVSVLAIEIGQHRKIIDTLGREAGDEYLREMGGRISRIRRKQDTVARLAGDEFAVMIDNLGDPDPVNKLASRIQGFLSAPVYIGKHSFAPRPYIGVGMFPTDAPDAVGLLRNADLAMHDAKNRGHAGVCFFSEDMGERARQRLTLESDLRAAIFKDEFVVHFQPMFELETGKLAGVESFLRWQHPKSGTIELQEFTQIAEETGMAAPLGETALWLTFEAVRKWKAMGHWPLRVMHNLSPSQLVRSDALLRQLQGMLLDSQIDPRHIQFSIHEPAMPLTAKQQYALLKIEELGIRLCVDHFGTGVSPLSYLPEFPVHAIKLAPTLIANAAEDENREAILSATVQMAHSLAIEVITTGVDQKSQLETAGKIGSDTIQGELQCPILGFEELCNTLFDEKTVTRTNTSTHDNIKKTAPAIGKAD